MQKVNKTWKTCRVKFRERKTERSIVANYHCGTVLRLDRYSNINIKSDKADGEDIDAEKKKRKKGGSTGMAIQFPFLIFQ